MNDLAVELKGLSASAVIKNTFSLRGRGLVLVLENLQGSFICGDAVTSRRGVSSFTGPEFLDYRDSAGAKVAALCIIAIDPNAAAIFQEGDPISFVPSSG